MKCLWCDKEFKEEDEIISSKAGGKRAIIHNECHFEWLLQHDYVEYLNYSDLLKEE